MKKFSFDVKKITSIMTAMVMMCICTFNYSMKTSAVNTSQMYNVYNAQTGNYTSCYSLNPLPSSNNSRAVIGSTDDRVEDWSKSGVVKIVTDFLGEKYPATGFVIDEHTIATAACNVYSQTVEHIYLFDENGEVDLDITDAVEYHIPYSYLTVLSDATQYDYALITVTQDLSDYACFTLGVALDSAVENEIAVTTTGFPATVSGYIENLEDEHNMFSGYGNLVDIESANYNRQIFYNTDTTGGNSGSPVYITETRGDKTYYTVIAIHKGTHESEPCNVGTRITTDLIHFYYGNPNI